MTNNGDIAFDKLKGPWMKELPNDEWWARYYAWRKAKRAKGISDETPKEEKPC